MCEFVGNAMPIVVPTLVNPSSFDAEKYASRFLVDCPKKVPLVAYLRVDDEGDSRLITWSSVEKSRNGLRGLDQKAVRNLGNRVDRPGWQPENWPYRGGEVTVLRRTGDVLTGSDILDPEVMEIVHNYFDKKTVHVAVPHAGAMLASDSPKYLYELAARERDRAPKEEFEPLLDLVYRVQEGEITHVLDIEPLQPEPEYREVNGESLFWFSLTYNDNFQELHDEIVGDFKRYIPNLVHDWDFQGKVVFEVTGEKAIFSIDEAKALHELESYMNDKVKADGLVAPCGSALEISILFEQAQKLGKRPRQKTGESPAVPSQKLLNGAPKRVTETRALAMKIPDFMGRSPYETLNSVIPNKLWLTMLGLRLWTWVSIVAFGLGGIGACVMLGMAGRWAIGAGAAVAGLAVAVVAYLLCERVFITNLKQCRPWARKILLVVSLLSVLGLNLFGLLIAIGLLHKGTKQLFDEAARRRNS